MERQRERGKKFIWPLFLWTFLAFLPAWTNTQRVSSIPTSSMETDAQSFCGSSPVPPPDEFPPFASHLIHLTPLLCMYSSALMYLHVIIRYIVIMFLHDINITYHAACRRQTSWNDSFHPAHHLFELLPSMKHYTCRSIKTRTTRFMNSFYPKAIIIMNSVLKANWNTSQHDKL